MIKRKNIVTGVLIGATLYFAFFFLFGEYGFLKYSKLQRERSFKEEHLAKLTETNSKLESKIEAFRGKTIDKDLLDEQVRKNLGLAEPNEVIIYYEK